jgi:hypothetical protein
LRRTPEVTGLVDKIFPNPFNSNINIIFNKPISENITVELYDLSGRKLYESTSIHNEMVLQVDFAEAAIRPGAYLLKVTGENETKVFKVVKR